MGLVARDTIALEDDDEEKRFQSEYQPRSALVSFDLGGASNTLHFRFPIASQ